MPILPTRTMVRTNDLQARYPEDVRTIAVRLPPNVSYAAGQVLAENGNIVTRNEVQTVTITGTPTGGTFTLVFPYLGATGNIAYNATAATVQAALDALIGAGNCVVTGGPGPGTPWVVTFANEYGNRDVGAMTTTAAFTGGTSPAVAVAETTKGSAGPTECMTAVVDANSDGTQLPKGVLLVAAQTDDKGCVVGEFGVGNQVTVPMAISGEFPCSKLVGLVANHVTLGNAKQLGRLVSGNAITDSGAIIRIGT